MVVEVEVEVVGGAEVQVERPETVSACLHLLLKDQIAARQGSSWVGRSPDKIFSRQIYCGDRGER